MFSKPLILWVFTLIYICVSGDVCAQNKYLPESNRRIYIVTSSEIIEGYINTKKSIKPQKNKKYFWCDNVKVDSTVGGYYKYLLDDKYIELYYPEKKMKCSGSYVLGLKDGEWLSWYKNGNLRSVCNWKKGTLNGSAEYFAYDGQLKEKVVYKKGVLVTSPRRLTLKSIQHNISLFWNKCKRVFE